METLKAVLEKDQSKKTKAELVELLNGIEGLLTPSVYEKVSGLTPAEAAELPKKEILEILNSFKENYDSKWEKSLAGVSSSVLNMVFGQIKASEMAFKAADADDANFAAELGSIDFAKIIGGPLDACVRAQTNASVSTVAFINNVGFEVTDVNTGAKKLRMAEFKYKKNIPNPDFNPEEEAGDDNPKTIETDAEISVPFIALLNVPSFRIESCDIDFNVKLKSTFTQNVTTQLGVDTSFSTGSSGISNLFAKVNFKVDVSTKRTTSTGTKIEKEYSLGVKVRATNDEMPAGLEKVLGLLAN